jgi:hypothetical protein
MSDKPTSIDRDRVVVSIFVLALTIVMFGLRLSGQ